MIKAQRSVIKAKGSEFKFLKLNDVKLKDENSLNPVRTSFIGCSD